MSRRVKLQLHHMEGKQTVVDNFLAESWDNFVLIRSKQYMIDDQLSELRQVFQGKFPDKQVIVLAHDVDVEFFGLEEVAG